MLNGFRQPFSAKDDSLIILVIIFGHLFTSSDKSLLEVFQHVACGVIIFKE